MILSRDQTCAPCICRQILNYRTTREAPGHGHFHLFIFWFLIEMTQSSIFSPSLIFLLILSQRLNLSPAFTYKVILVIFVILVTFDFTCSKGFPHSSVGKASACNAGDPSLIPGLGRSPGEGIGYPPQCS